MPAVAEEPMGIATPAMEMSLEQAAELGLTDAAELPDEFSSAPFIPEGEVEKTIIGADDRVTVKSPGKYPYSAIAYMYVKASCGCDWVGSGFMVSRYCLMTAAHCIVCCTHGKSASQMTLYFGYRSNKDYYYRYDGATTYWYGTNFSNGDGTYSYSPHTDWDYAYVKLERPMGDKTGWFGTQSRIDSHLSKGTYEVAGYRDGTLKTSQGKVSALNEYQISYTIDTLPGNSGCPIFDSEYYAVGINIAQNDTKNFGRRITTSLLQEMRRNGMFD